MSTNQWRIGMKGASKQALKGVPLPPPPVGFVYLRGSDGAYLRAADGAYLLGAIP